MENALSTNTPIDITIMKEFGRSQTFAISFVLLLEHPDV